MEIIDLSEYYTKKLGLRSTAKKLFKRILEEHYHVEEKYNEIVLDFKNVEFMSRAFAQEYFYQKSLAPVKIIEINLSGFVKEIYDVVQEDYEWTKRRN